MKAPPRGATGLRADSKYYDFRNPRPDDGEDIPGDLFEYKRQDPPELENDPPAAAKVEEADTDELFGFMLTGGYAFRPHTDRRNHGLTLQATADMDLDFLGMRLEGSFLGFGPSAEVDQPFGLALASSSLLVMFDEPFGLILGFGAFLGSPVDLNDGGHLTGLIGGYMSSIDLRFRLMRHLALVVSGRVPVVLLSDLPVGAPPPSWGYIVVTTGLALTF